MLARVGEVAPEFSSIEERLGEATNTVLYAAAVGEVRRTTYQQDESLSRDQAIRDIQALTRAGLLTPRGNATTRVYALDGAATEIARAATAAVRGPGRDPYAKTRQRQTPRAS